MFEPVCPSHILKPLQTREGVILSEVSRSEAEIYEVEESLVLGRIQRFFDSVCPPSSDKLRSE